MKIREIMTSDVRCISPDASLVEAAKLLNELDVGALPVCDQDRLAGMITDRDIVVRALAQDKDPRSTRVRDAMTEGIVYVYEDDNIEDAAQHMESKQIRRLAVLNREKRLVGLVSTADIALETSSRTTGEILREVSVPSGLQAG